MAPNMIPNFKYHMLFKVKDKKEFTNRLERPFWLTLTIPNDQDSEMEKRDKWFTKAHFGNGHFSKMVKKKKKWVLTIAIHLSNVFLPFGPLLYPFPPFWPINEIKWEKKLHKMTNRLFFCVIFW